MFQERPAGCSSLPVRVHSPPAAGANERQTNGRQTGYDSPWFRRRDRPNATARGWGTAAAFQATDDAIDREDDVYRESVLNTE
jgi:hypothetical protein